MDIISSVFDFSAGCLSRFSTNKSRTASKNKVHDFTKQSYGRDFIFEAIDEGSRGYLTGQGKGIKVGDYLILPNGANSSYYRVEEIDYYSNPSTMWIALLNKVSTQTQP